MALSSESASFPQKKASYSGAFFYGLAITLFVLLFDARLVLAGVCSPSLSGETVHVKKVFDGDTVLLEDGRKVRLIGVNTPETGKKGVASEPLADEAMREARRFVSASRSVRILFETERADRYGRSLAHLVNESGESLEKRLIDRGLGFSVTFPPNLAFRECLQRAEDSARRSRVGIWGMAYYEARPASAVTDQDAGFRRIKGKVEKISIIDGKTWWLMLEGNVALQITKHNQPYFSVQSVKSLYGQSIEVKGWLTSRKLSEKQKKKQFKPMVMSLMHPDMILVPH
ncbi:MAG: thermonuclease family protein [Hahellaceae bacterium]|nr:thermonuclease family protein [Hahellaceae bacterium]MCP5168678.1 thermonuclease family protein [Hahellaceae bacterium]